MQVYMIPPRGFAANCYLVTADGETAVAIDPAQPRVLREAEERGLRITHVLLTHGHFDHVGGCAVLQARGAAIGCLDIEKELAEKHNLSRRFSTPIAPFSVDFLFRDGERLSLDGLTIGVIATPGHTAGSCCFAVDDALFTGDTLFLGDVGRCDLPTGSAAAMEESLKKLAKLPDYIVYPGHGTATTLQREKEYGYLRM